MKNCPHCKKTIQSNFVFCPNCGNTLMSANSKHEAISKGSTKKTGANRKMKNRNNLSISIGIVVFIIIVGIFWIVQDFGEASQGKIVTTNKVTPTNSIANQLKSQPYNNTDIYQVASYFECSCGDCQDHELASCDCPTAKSQRDFIQKHLDQGKDLDEVRMIVYETYGNMKPQYIDWYKKQMEKSLQKLNASDQ